MANIYDDVKIQYEIFEGINHEQWKQIYAWNTENLDIVFNYINVKKKDVFSVLSSSDILFRLLLNGASNVDTFDINPLTLRYYYLRKWLLEYGYINVETLEFDDIKNIIENHSETDGTYEHETKFFWEEYIKECINYTRRGLDYKFYVERLFIIPITCFSCSCKLKDIKKLLNKLNSKPLKFDELDITSKFRTKKKYDCIYLSNILDYVDSYERLLYNLNNILKDDGFIVGNNMFNLQFVDTIKRQNNYFLDYYNYEEFYTDLRRVDKEPVKYYIYKKKYSEK